MKKLFEFIKKHKTPILIFLVVMFFFRSCGNSTKVRRLEKNKVENGLIIDSLYTIINTQKDTINNIPEIIRLEKIKIHMTYNSWITPQDRHRQLIELQKIVNKNIDELQKK
jgi:hypothetical protein